MAVMIGIDPHKGSHTAVAIGPAGEPLGRQWVRACPDQARQLLAWAQAWPERTWAVEGATGLGRLLQNDHTAFMAWAAWLLRAVASGRQAPAPGPPRWRGRCS